MPHKRRKGVVKHTGAGPKMGGERKDLWDIARKSSWRKTTPRNLLKNRDGGFQARNRRRSLGLYQKYSGRGGTL